MGSDANVTALLRQYRCPMPLHAVRAFFMGSIVSPLEVSPVKTMQQLWGDELPEINDTEEFNQLMHVLIGGLWNRLTEHQDSNKPFELRSINVKLTRAGLRQVAAVRGEEIEAFLTGLFGSQETADLTEEVDHSVKILSQAAGMFMAVVTLLDDSSKPGSPEDFKSLNQNLQELSGVIEIEINSIIYCCVRDRREALAEMPPGKPIVN